MLNFCKNCSLVLYDKLLSSGGFDYHFLPNFSFSFSHNLHFISGSGGSGRAGLVVGPDTVTGTVMRTSRGRRVAFEVSLKPRQNQGWTLIVVSGRALREDTDVSLAIGSDSLAGESSRFFIPIRFGRRTLARVLLVHFPPLAERIIIEVDCEDPKQSLKLRLLAVTQRVAALILICLQPSIILQSGLGKSKRGESSFRKRMALAAIRLGPRISYLAWQRRFDCWEMGLVGGTRFAMPNVLVFTNGDQDRAALDATIASLAAAYGSTTNLAKNLTIIDGSQDNSSASLVASLDLATEDFLVVLQAGEVIPPHAIRAAMRFADLNQLAIVYADEDKINFAGDRSDPLFKPEPSRMLMLSGSLATGMFLIRRDVLSGLVNSTARCADALRLDAWLCLDDRAIASGDAPRTGRLPLILTHRRSDTAATSPDVLAAIARSHLGSSWVGEIDATRLPLRIRPGIAAAPKVSLIVASTGRLAHVRECLCAILEQTRYPDFEMIIVLSQNSSLDAVQQDILAPIIADARVRVVFAPMTQFNYSRANNVAVSHSTAPLICLLNDDVTPITADWLAIMVGHLQDQRVGAVGAKLYYPEGTVQHAGVVIGLSGLADHSFRFLPRADAGYAGRASVEQELSAVTAACMLVRRPVFDAVGGLDENFASAFNDVDLCLKIRAAGHRIVWSAQAELWHHETISFGKHYADEDKPLADRDVRIMRERWTAECAADPFHNPNLSLEVMSEWELAFPPRLGELPEALGLVACS